MCKHTQVTKAHTYINDHFGKFRLPRLVGFERWRDRTISGGGGAKICWPRVCVRVSPSSKEASRRSRWPPRTGLQAPDKNLKCNFWRHAPRVLRARIYESQSQQACCCWNWFWLTQKETDGGFVLVACLDRTRGLLAAFHGPMSSKAVVSWWLWSRLWSRLELLSDVNNGMEVCLGWWRHHSGWWRQRDFLELTDTTLYWSCWSRSRNLWRVQESVSDFLF